MLYLGFATQLRKLWRICMIGARGMSIAPDAVEPVAMAASSAVSRGAPANRWLAALPQRYQREFEQVHLSAGQVVELADERIEFIYFPMGALLSVLVPMQD